MQINEESGEELEHETDLFATKARQLVHLERVTSTPSMARSPTGARQANDEAEQRRTPLPTSSDVMNCRVISKERKGKEEK